MGLDAVEIVLRAEELFVIAISDEEAGSVITVGDFYKVICEKLNLTPLQSPVTSDVLPKITQKEEKLIFFQSSTPLPAPPEVLPWSPQSAWDTLVAIFVDQMCLDPEEVTYNAGIAKDLRID